MHVQIVKSAQAQAEDVQTMRDRIRALEAQLRDLGVEPTTEHSLAQASEAAPAARDFTVGNNHVSIRPAPGSVSAAAATQVGPPRQIKASQRAAAADQAQSQSVGQKATEQIDDASLRYALIELDDPPRRP